MLDCWQVKTDVCGRGHLHPSWVIKLSTSFGWGKGGKVTAAGWQVHRVITYSMWFPVAVWRFWLRTTISDLFLLTLYPSDAQHQMVSLCQHQTIEICYQWSDLYIHPYSRITTIFVAVLLHFHSAISKPIFTIFPKLVMIGSYVF